MFQTLNIGPYAFFTNISHSSKSFPRTQSRNTLRARYLLKKKRKIKAVKSLMLRICKRQVFTYDLTVKHQRLSSFLSFNQRLPLLGHQTREFQRQEPLQKYFIFFFVCQWARMKTGRKNTLPIAILITTVKKEDGIVVCVCKRKKEREKTDYQPSLRKPCLKTMQSCNAHIGQKIARIFNSDSV